MCAKDLYFFVWTTLVDILIMFEELYRTLVLVMDLELGVLIISLWISKLIVHFNKIFVHCGEKPWIPQRLKCLLHCDFPFIWLKYVFICIRSKGLGCGIPFKMGKWTLLINFALKLCTLFCFLGHHFVVLWYFSGVFFMLLCAVVMWAWRSTLVF